MGQVLSIADFRRREKKVHFDRRELSKLLSLYSRRVISGEWRDYAIDHEASRVIFSVFRNTAETPIFSVAKEAGRDPRFVVMRGWRKISSARSVDEAVRDVERELRLGPRILHA